MSYKETSQKNNSQLLRFASCLAVSMATKQFLPSWITPGWACWLNADQLLVLVALSCAIPSVAFETRLLLCSKAIFSSPSLTDLMLRRVTFGFSSRTTSDSKLVISSQQTPTPTIPGLQNSTLFSSESS